MAADLNHIYQEALMLSPLERAELVERLFSSFDFADRDSLDKKWAVEAESRLDAYYNGKMSTRSLTDILSDIQKM